jgi:hypothetical protein
MVWCRPGTRAIQWFALGFSGKSWESAGVNLLVGVVALLAWSLRLQSPLSRRR